MVCCVLFKTNFQPPFPDTTDASVQQALQKEEAVCGLMSALTVAKVKQMKDSSTNTNGTYVSEAIIPINRNDFSGGHNGHNVYNGHNGHNLNSYSNGHGTNGHNPTAYAPNGPGNGPNGHRNGPNSHGNSPNDEMYATVNKIKYVPKVG